MAIETTIEWADSTFSPWIGCTKISPACDHCYAAVSTPARTLGIEWGAGKLRHRTGAANWKQPLRWDRKAAAGLFVECVCGHREFRVWDNSLPPGGLSFCTNRNCSALPESESDRARPRVFCSSLADVFDNEVPIEWLVDLLELIRTTPNLDWLLLTKRIGNALPRLRAAVSYHGGISMELAGWLGDWLGATPPENVWLGATICNQDEADRDIPKLITTPARVRFLSIEPMLSEIDLTAIPLPSGRLFDALSGNNEKGVQISQNVIDWVITGGESEQNGQPARPSNPQWFRDIRDQCDDTAYLHKQNGEWVSVSEMEGEGEHFTFPDGRTVRRVGITAAGRTLDGITHTEFPRGKQC